MRNSKLNRNIGTSMLIKKKRKPRTTTPKEARAAKKYEEFISRCNEFGQKKAKLNRPDCGTFYPDRIKKNKNESSNQED